MARNQPYVKPTTIVEEVTPITTSTEPEVDVPTDTQVEPQVPELETAGLDVPSNAEPEVVLEDNTAELPEGEQSIVPEDNADQPTITSEEEEGIQTSLDTEEESEAEEELHTVAVQETVVSYGAADTRVIIKRKDLTVAEKLELLTLSSIPSVVSLATGLIRYRDRMSKHSLIEAPKVAVLNNYNLYTLIRLAASVTDSSDFKDKFDIINMTFDAYKDDAYKDINLMRYDVEWIWGSETLVAYQRLVTLIHALCTFKTRAKELEKLSVNSALDKTVTGLSDTVINNIKSYYLS